MSTEEKKINADVSASKKKREERKKKYNKAKTKNLISKIVGIVVIILIAAAILFGIGRSIYKASQKVTASDEYSKCLEDNGFVKGVKATSYITLPDYKNMQVALSDVEFTDEQVEEEIQKKLEQNKVLSDDSSLTVADGDTVSIDYVGTVDGVEFDGGNSNGEGYDLEIGSGSFVDDFEQQLIGAAPGDSVTVEVTFPEDYSSADLAGKDAEFAVDVHGIYQLPEFTDEFVAEHLKANADTVEGYKEYLKKTNYDKNLKEYLENKIIEDSAISKYPSSYLKQLERVKKYDDEQGYEYMNQMYMSYYGQGYEDFYQYVGQTEEEYDASLVDAAKEIEKERLVYQAIMESEGIVLTEQDYRDYLIAEYESDESFDTNVEAQGLGYCLQQVMKEKAIQILIDNCTVK